MFKLPITTSVNRVIPKNSFDKFLTTKGKKELSDKVEKIRWMHKLSFDTTNLPSVEIKEVQIFEVVLKTKDNIFRILDTIDKSIPYPIIFVVIHDNEVMLSASQKHSHPTQENISVIDWTFSSNWLRKGEIGIQLNLRESIDFVFADVCSQLATTSSKIPLEELIALEKEKKSLERNIDLLKSKLSTCRQFNQKLELNKQLKSFELAYSDLLNKSVN